MSVFTSLFYFPRRVTSASLLTAQCPILLVQIEVIVTFNLPLLTRAKSFFTQEPLVNSLGLFRSDSACLGIRSHGGGVFTFTVIYAIMNNTNDSSYFIRMQVFTFNGRSSFFSVTFLSCKVVKTKPSVYFWCKNMPEQNYIGERELLKMYFYTFFSWPEKLIQQLFLSEKLKDRYDSLETWLKTISYF